jgi:hypothetical protein
MSDQLVTITYNFLPKGHGLTTIIAAVDLDYWKKRLETQ